MKNVPAHEVLLPCSCLEVTFGDAVGESNRTLLMQLVRADGMVLKADRPATAIDRQFQVQSYSFNKYFYYSRA